MKKLFYLTLLTLGTLACNNEQEQWDASGVFEADEIIVSAEAMGKIVALDIEEGQRLKKDQVLGKIDDQSLSLQKSQLEASVKSLYEKRGSAQPQTGIYREQIKAQKENIATLNEQLKVLNRDRARMENLVKADAAPAKQLDDINGQISILSQQIKAAEANIGTLQQQIKSAESSVSIQNRAVLSEEAPLEQRIASVDDQIDRTTIISPMDGTVLTSYLKKDEFATIGKPIFKIAKTDQLILRAYITEAQLAEVKLGQEVNVSIGSESSAQSLKGKISWISSKAEFTPKTIQTKDERSNLVYAIKIVVPNDGQLKIGMYGDVAF